MTPLPLAVGTRVKIDPRSEAYPGATVYIVDTCDDPEYPYCVGPTPKTRIVSDTEWVRREHVRPVDVEPHGLEIGDLVTVDPIASSTVQEGYILAIEPEEGGRVVLGRHPDAETADVLVSKHLVSRVEP